MGLNDVVSGAYSSVFDMSLNEFILKIFIAFGLVLFGIFLGKILVYALKQLAEKIELEKNIRQSFINLILAVITWSIYIIFINLAIIQLSIPGLAEMISKTLVVIPALTGALILIAIGFAIGLYLRDVIEDSDVTGWKMISQYFFYFIVYIFGVYALKLALISLDAFVTNMIIIVLTAIVGVAIAYSAVKKNN